ncbi:MAG: hypothetical protein QOE96_479 [Blastocatellia bacterium]|jgi:hypothetical protein|nr:hypothetical protein [Blastocatellia bacterium]
MESSDILRTIFESLKYLSIVVGSASGLIGATTQTKDKDTGRPNAAGKWLIGIIVGSLVIGVTSQAVESTLKRKQEEAARTAADAQRGKLDNLVGTAQQSSDQLTGLVKTATDSVAKIEELRVKQIKALADTNSILEGVRKVSGDVKTVSSDTKAVSKDVLMTFDLARRASKPFLPSKIFMRVTYKYLTTSGEIQDYVNTVRANVEALEANRADPRWKNSDRVNWDANPTSIALRGPSFLTSLGGLRVQRLLTQQTVGMKIRATKGSASEQQANQIELTGYASFKRNTPSQPVSDAVIVPRPSNLEIFINRRTGDIIQLFTIESIDIRGDVGLHSLYDLPDKLLEIDLRASEHDQPKMECFTYQNDTMNTGGKLRDFITLESRRFEGPNAAAPLFTYLFKENDLTIKRDCREQALSVTAP